VNRTQIEEVVRSAYEARVRGDLDAVMAHFADGAQFSLTGSATASPVPLSASGGAAVREVMRRLVEGFEFRDPKILTLIVEEDRAAVHWTVRVRATATGREAQTELVDLLRFSDGKIASFQQFADTALAAQLLAG
jgi:ketosteroid isomerase-like protein